MADAHEGFEEDGEEVHIESDARKFINGNITFFIFSFFVALNVFIAIYILKGDALLNPRIEVLLVWAGLILAFLLPIRAYIENAKLMKYSLPKEIFMFPEGFRFRTYGKWESECLFSDTLLIFDREMQFERSKLSSMPLSYIYYRDRKLKKINLIMVDDRALEVILQRYREYIEGSKDERRALLMYDIPTLREVEYARIKGRLDALLEKYRANRKLEVFE